MYKLKPNISDFEIVDGQWAGRKYKSGEIYAEVPTSERHKFDVVCKKRGVDNEQELSSKL